MYIFLNKAMLNTEEREFLTKLLDINYEENRFEDTAPRVTREIKRKLGLD